MRMEGGAIPLFDGKGYEIWSKKMKTLFVSQELWGLVQLGYEGEATDMGLGENRKKDCKALYMIQQGVSNSIFPVIVKANTSKEAWEAIRDKFHNYGRHDQQQQQIEEIEVEMGRTTIHIDRMLSKLNPIYPERCIFRVPDALRLGNEEFYEPTVLSIGPYHRGKPRLASMEEHKIRYLQQLLQRMGEKSVNRFVRVVMPQEQRVRKCYAESIDSVSSDDLIKMLVLDGCFIIELLRRMGDRQDQPNRWFHERGMMWRQWYHLFGESDDDDPKEADGISSNKLINDEPVINYGVISSNELIKDDPVINSDVSLNALQNDLLLVENQIPFFIIEILYHAIRGTGSHIKKLKTLILAFICRKYLVNEIAPQEIINRLNVHDMCHLLDIAHKTLCSIKKDVEVQSEDLNLQPFWLDFAHKTLCCKKKDVEVQSEDLNLQPFCFVDSATKLEEANVTLSCCFDSSIFNITFINGKLTIPSFEIFYHLEIDIRNFIALELCQQDRKKRYFCDYAVFMDHLIASPDDVELLIHRGIITNQMIDPNFVDNMFKKLTRNIVPSDPYTYYKISKELNEYCDRPLNKWSASLKQKYCQSPWTFISVLAASMLLTLTITQTWYSIISYYK